MRVGAILLFALSAPVFGQGQYILENEHILVGFMESITHRRESGDQFPNSPIFLESCGTETLEISEVEVLAGAPLPSSIRTVNRLGEFCQSTLRMRLFPGPILMSVASQDDRLSVSWFVLIRENASGVEVIDWTAELDDRFGELVSKKRCEFVDEPDAPCYEVQLDDFLSLFRD